MFGHQSLVPRNNIASYKFPQGKLYNLRSLSWWNSFFWGQFSRHRCLWSLNMKFSQSFDYFIGKEITFCGLILSSIGPMWAQSFIRSMFLLFYTLLLSFSQSLSLYKRMWLSFYVRMSLSFSLSLSFCWSGEVASSLWAFVGKDTHL